MKYDAIVIGSGAGGYYFSIAASNIGKKILLIEKEKIGGTAFATGCLPIKRHLQNLKTYKRFLQEFKNINLELGSGKIYENGKEKIKAIEDELKGRLLKTDIEIVIGEAKIISTKTVEVEGKNYSADRIILATGTKACTLDSWASIDEKVVFSHRGILGLEELPKELMILGGNVEGIEFASLFSALGTKVIIIEQENEILIGNDRDLVEPIIEELEKNDVEFLLGTRVENLNIEDEKAVLGLNSKTSIEADKILITGIRKPNLPISEDIEFELENGYLKTDMNLETSVKNIFAIGDINGRHGMAHIAIQQALMLVDYIWKAETIRFNYETLPCAMFTIPELAGAGWQENNHQDTRVINFDLSETLRSGASGKLKLILHENIVKGAWMSGLFASDLMGQVSLWIDDGLTIDDFKKKLWIHPTIQESFLECAIK